MKRLPAIAAIALAIVLVLLSAPGARAQDEITLAAPGIMKTPFDMLIPGFEMKTGHKVKATYGAEDGVRQQAAKGDPPVDVPVIEAPYDTVIASGNVVAGSETALSSIPVGVAVKKGAPKPDISTPDAVKSMLLAAKSIAFPNPAPAAASGISVTDSLKRLGIADQLQPKITLTQGGGRAMTMVANGTAEIGLTFLPGMTDAGIDIVGTLPNAISTPTRVVGFVSTHAKDPAAAKALLAYLSSPEAAAAYKASMMQPGR